MPAERGFLAASGRTNRFHVERTGLLAEIDIELARTGIVTVCGPWGYGRTSLVGDYARIAHARMPSRPVVRVDFSTYEAQAFLAGNRAPLMRALERRNATPADGSGDGTDAAARRGRRRGRQGADREPRRLPARYANDVTRLVYECIAAEAPAWCARFERCPVGGDAPFGALPLVVVDDLPFLDEATLGELADALTAWSRAGARLLVVCSPVSRIPHALLPDAFEVTASMLTVSHGELALWSHDLRFPDGIDVEAATAGVPMLVDACRSVRDGDPAFDEGFLRAADRVLEHCLGELMCEQAERGRWAMAMLGSGTLADLAAVGVRMREDELAILAETYPLFGIDMLAGTFSCIPVPLGRGAGSCVRAVSGDEGLAMNCIERLLRGGRVKRAGELAALLSEAGRLRLFGRNPDAFADAAVSGSIERSMRAVALGDPVDGALQPGLARLSRLHAHAHDIPARLLPDGVLKATAGTSEGALRAVRAVLGFWSDYTGFGAPAAGEAAEGAGTDGADDEAAGVSVGVEGVVRAMALAGLKGDAAAYRAQLEALCDAVPVAQGGLAAAVYLCHAAVCGFLCDQVETVLSLVEPLAGASVDPDAAPGSVATASNALLVGVYATARLLVERPSALRIAGEALACVRRARTFFEERRIEPAAAFMLFLEAVCLIAGGNERQAAAALGSCRSRWGARGTVAGQLACSLALCVCDLADDAVSQASVRAQTAESLAQRMGLRRAVWLARMLGSVAAVRNGNVPDMDRRLLEATLRRSALHPDVSIPLEVEAAILYAARGDAPAARDILQGVGIFGRPQASRLLVTAVRALGRSRSCVLDLLPRRLRLEYEGMRPSSALRRYLGSDEAPADKPGLLALPRMERGMSIDVLGGLRVAINGHVVGDAEWGRRKVRLVLLVLAVFAESPVPRDSMVEALWEGSSVNALTRNNLNTVLSSLRASLGQKGGGPGYLVTTGGTIGFNLELVDVDVLRFERLARTLLARPVGNLETVDACSRLEQIFQTGFGTEFAGLPRFVRRRAAELEDLFVQCMLRGSAAALEEGDAQIAAWFARKAARVRPQSGDVHAAMAGALEELTLREGGVASGKDLADALSGELVALQAEGGGASPSPVGAKAPLAAAASPFASGEAAAEGVRRKRGRPCKSSAAEADAAAGRNPPGPGLADAEPAPQAEAVEAGSALPDAPQR